MPLTQSSPRAAVVEVRWIPSEDPQRYQALLQTMFGHAGSLEMTRPGECESPGPRSDDISRPDRSMGRSCANLP